jgi:hypothetical protein
VNHSRPRHRRRPFLRGIAAVLASASILSADQVEYTAYWFKDNKENNVATTSFSLAKTLWQRTMLLLDVELDQLTIPALDGVTGASRPQRQATREFRKSRGQIIAGVDQALGEDTRLAANYYFSQEVDYKSQAAVGTLTREFFQKNFTVALRGQYTVDRVGEITSTGALIERPKEVHQASLTLTQLLSPTTIVRVGGDGFRLQGFLSDPYRLVSLPGEQPRAENHPSERWRQAAWGELSQYLRGLDGSVTLNYRYYWDDWEMDSHTLHLKLNKYVTPDWILSPEYRYYIQSGAGFYEDGNDGRFFTGDYKLKPFESNTMGVGVTWFLRSLARKRPNLDFLDGSSVALLYFHYFNSAQDARFSANVLEARVKFDY